MSHRAQVLVELALTLPFVMFLILGSVEVGFLLIDKADIDRSASVVAIYAAEHPGNESWRAVANRELAGCVVTMTEPLADLTEIRADCRHKAILPIPFFDGLQISSQATAAMRSEPAFQSPTPAASPSFSSITRPARLVA